MEGILDLELLESARAYILEGRLVKYRSGDKGDMDVVLVERVYTQSKVTKQEIEYLKTKGNLAIQENGKTQVYKSTKE